jgi:hypothetical protein
MTREELIAALEAATGPSWELDGFICEAVGAVKPEATPHWEWPPRYTASIDAALTLVPEGASGAIEFGNHTQACVVGGPWCDGATPAIALCIAALKARA